MAELPALMCMLSTHNVTNSGVTVQLSTISEKIRCKATNLEALFCMHLLARSTHLFSPS